MNLSLTYHCCHIYENISGIYTGSIYHDSKLRANGFPGEGKRDNSVVATKSHRVGRPMVFLRQLKRAIVLIRNPYESMMAEFNRKNGHLNHTKRINPKMFKTESEYRGFSGYPGSILTTKDLMQKCPYMPRS